MLFRCRIRKAGRHVAVDIIDHGSRSRLATAKVRYLLASYLDHLWNIITTKHDLTS
jgi:hypothetical protein